MQPKVDFLPCGEYCDFILCVVAFNDAGKNESCIFAEVVDAYGGKNFTPYIILQCPGRRRENNMPIWLVQVEILLRS